jgi:hypothetical protein
MTEGKVPSSGYVYVIDCGDSVKVGCSAQPLHRIKTLSNTIGLDSPRSFISKKCFDHHKNEGVVHKEIGGKSKCGEFFSAEFNYVVSVIDFNVAEITQSEIDLIDKYEEGKSVDIEAITNEIMHTSMSKASLEEKEAYKKILLDAISWADNFGLDYTDRLAGCNGCISSILAVSLQIHKEVIGQYADSIN